MYFTDYKFKVLVMWKRKLVWKNDSIEFTFQDRVVSLEESIQDDEMRFKATMKSGNQIKEVELVMTLKTVPEENNNPFKAEKREYYEEGSFLNPIKLQLEEDDQLTHALSEENEERTDAATPSGDETAAMATGPKQKEADVQGQGNNTMSVKDNQLVHNETTSIPRKIMAGNAKLGNGKNITFYNLADSDLSEKEIEEEEEDPNPKPAKRGRKTKGREKSPRPTAKQVCEEAEEPVEEHEEEEEAQEDDDEEEVPLSNRGRKSTGRVRKKKVGEEEDEDDYKE